MTRAIGVDVSHWDITFDPQKATKPIDFAIQKVSELNWRDQKLDTIWKGVRQVPMRGAYHYLRSEMDWLKQADFFLSVVAGRNFDFFACDFEDKNNVMSATFADACHRWMMYVCQQTKRPVLLYTNPNHYDVDLFPYGDWMKDYPLYLAQYWNFPSPNKSPGMPKNRKPGDWTIYQYASEKNFPGHSREYGCGANSVDLNVFNGTVADMRKWLGLDSTPPPILPSLTIEERVAELEGRVVKLEVAVAWLQMPH